MCALLAKPGLNQSIAIIQKYQARAIDAVNDVLPQIQEFHKGPKARTGFPWLTIAWDGTHFVEASQQSVEQSMQMTLTLEVGNFDSELAQDQAIDYALVLYNVFNVYSAPSFVDWETALPIKHETVPGGQTTPWKQGTVKEMFVETAEQSLVYRDEMETPIIQVSLRMRLDLEET